MHDLAHISSLIKISVSEPPFDFISYWIFNFVKVQDINVWLVVTPPPLIPLDVVVPSIDQFKNNLTLFLLCLCP